MSAQSESMAKFDTRLLPNYIVACAVIGVFLWAVGYSLVNAEYLLTIVNTGTPTQAFVMGSIVSTLFTALIFIVKEVSSYLFRKNPSNNEVPTPTP